MKNCPVCGTVNTDDTTFCSKCGSLLDQKFADHIDPSASNSNIALNGIDNNTEVLDNLYQLRSALYLLFLGTILSLIVVGVVIVLIGLFKLMSASERIGQLKLESAEPFKYVKKWIMYYLIMVIVSVVIVMAVVINLLINSVAVTLSQGTPHLLNSSLIIEALGILIVLAIVNLFVTIKTFLSLKNAFTKLGSELSVSELEKAGRYFYYYLILAVVTYVASFANLVLDVSRTSLAAMPIYILILFLAVDIVAFVFLLVALYSGYNGIDTYIHKKGRYF